VRLPNTCALILLLSSHVLATPNQQLLIGVNFFESDPSFVDRVAINAVLEGEASLVDPYAGNTESDLVLATVAFGIETAMTENHHESA